MAPMCAIKVGTIYFPIHQVPTAAVKDTADLLIEHRKLTLPLRPWKLVFPKWPTGSVGSVDWAIHRFVWHVEACHGGVRMMRQESFNSGIMSGATITAFMPARQREITRRYVKLLIICSVFTLHFQKCTSNKIKTLLIKKSKFHFVQYWKQIVPCESGLIKGFRPGAQE